MLRRYLNMGRVSLAKINTQSNGLIRESIRRGVEDHSLPQEVYEQMERKNTALEAARYFALLAERPEQMIVTEEYKQLPDDSQFITEHYEELVDYREKLVGKKGKYTDLGDAPTLFRELAKFNPRLGQRALFDKFVNDLKTTLRLNGGHLFVLDLLIHNQRLFDEFEQTKAE